LQLFLL